MSDTKKSEFPLTRTTPLSAAEIDRLRAIEANIEEHVKGFLRCGAALRAIGREQLFACHESFEQYCWERWGLTQVKANNQLPPAVRGLVRAEYVQPPAPLKMSPVGDKLNEVAQPNSPSAS